MTREEVLEIIEQVQTQQCELDDVEVKAAHGGTPTRLYESLSAFANRNGGGVIMLGVDERNAFEICGVRDLQRLQSDIGQAAADMEPPLRVEFTVVTIDGKTVVAVEVPEVSPQHRPCHKRSQGLNGGSFIRVGNANRRMSDYEIFGYASSRTQPTFDEEAAMGATMSDLDKPKLEEFVARLLREQPERASALSFDGSLVRLRIAKETDGVLRPTLAGLLTFGTHPQEREPQLVITFLQYYGTTEDEAAPGGARFIDNKKFEGPIPSMVEAAVNYVMRSIRKSSLIEGLYRREIPEYPEEAVREAIMNAVAHRDYSQSVRGSYIQIRLFADRLEIQSPGGLYGNVTEDTLEESWSTRNRTLMRLLEDLRLAENRGSGIQAMVGAMRAASLEPPRFRDNRNTFTVTFHSHSLMSPDAIAWLNQFAGEPLNERQRLALAYLRSNERMNNPDYRRLNHVDSDTARTELQGLVRARLIQQFGARRWAEYGLSVPAEVEPTARALTNEEKVLAYVRAHGWIANVQCRELLGVGVQEASSLLKKMHRSNMLKREGERRWARYRLP